MEPKEAQDGAGASGQVLSLRVEPARDAELLAGLRAGRPTAIAALYDRYAATVRRILTRMLSDASEADDLTQETFLIVLRRVDDIHRPEALRSFVVGTAVRTAKNELRRRAVRRFIGLDEDQGTLVVEPHDPVASEQIVRLQAVLQELNGESRALFLLRHVERLELTELASAFSCSLATIKRKLARVESTFRALVRSDRALRDLVPEETP